VPWRKFSDLKKWLLVAVCKFIGLTDLSTEREKIFHELELQKAVSRLEFKMGNLLHT